ncbi:MAG: flagellar hook-basal body complex protein [Burkholderiales bacterium]|jgi:flagellar hook protein FlgE|nr:flagellar hook-basal body complex protein [Burkholderiales bacterium]
MLDSILIGLSGMEGFSRGLKVISNNVANLNTAGFKSSTMQFSDAYYQQAGVGTDPTTGEPDSFGSGLATSTSVIDFSAGELQSSNNPLDTAIGGNGYYVFSDKETNARTFGRDGQFEFDKDGALVSTSTGKYVIGYASAGSQDLTKITLDGLRSNPPKATTTVKFNGNLNPTPATGATVAEATLDSVVIDDALGALHTLKLDIKNNGSGGPNSWTVAVTDSNGNAVGTGTIGFVGGAPDPSADTMTVNYTPSGDGSTLALKLDFSTDVTSYANGNLSALAVTSQDGFGAGSISATTFDSDGKLSITYSNGQTAKGAQLALAHFDSTLGLKQVAGAQFEVDDGSSVHLGRPGANGLGTIEASEIENSNVDLSGEFSNLIVMQRGYQASSNVISTANEMLQQLFDLHGSR